ncbi:hypothetical protein A7D27_23890 [Pseudomonas sp. 1D4]|uniref:hypothetical protein n=1 Tax=Pseudomonadaceae TaxID=135621 RepID=UPI00084A74F6|nr:MULTISPECIES: hypothetical protein [Pseudomonas]OEC37925.1 hypothetical protein A7D27_23890 [Pseudomonas sp. 1D4]
MNDHNRLDKPSQKPRFDAFMDLRPAAPWNQRLHILDEAIDVAQQPSGSVFVHYVSSNPIIQTLMVALCGIYRGHAESELGRWYFHAQLQPNLRVALLALQDKPPSQIAHDIQRSTQFDGPQARESGVRHESPRDTGVS